MKGAWIDFDNLEEKKEETVLIDGKKYIIMLKDVQEVGKPALGNAKEEEKEFFRKRLKRIQEKYAGVGYRYIDPLEPTTSEDEWEALR